MPVCVCACVCLQPITHEFAGVDCCELSAVIGLDWAPCRCSFGDRHLCTLAMGKQENKYIEAKADMDNEQSAGQCRQH